MKHIYLEDIYIKKVYIWKRNIYYKKQLGKIYIDRICKPRNIINRKIEKRVKYIIFNNKSNIFNFL